ncbi:MAG TPA: hypothetical protein VMN58_04160 [Acidimicrobiales bacterium]|nr:hypothetical protein [Acidimicrobiales bacterium]
MNVRRGMWAAAAAVTLLGLVGCGDDDGETTGASDTTVAGDEHQEYCDASAALDEADGPPTADQVNDLVEIAPDDILDDVELAAERYSELGMDAFADGEFNQAIERVEEWEAENCEGREEDEEEEAEPQEPEEGAARVELTATEYAFELSGPVASGRTALVLTNDGEEDHHIDIVRFKEGTTKEEAEAAAEEGPSALFGLIEEDTDFGGPTTSTDAGPGEQAVLNLDLEPGLYGIACFVSAADGQPHFFKGMFTIVEVS